MTGDDKGRRIPLQDTDSGPMRLSRWIITQGCSEDAWATIGPEDRRRERKGTDDRARRARARPDDDLRAFLSAEPGSRAVEGALRGSDADPRVLALDEILATARTRILEALTFERHPELAPGWSRRDVRRRIFEAVGLLSSDLRGWADQYLEAGPLASAEQAHELRRLDPALSAGMNLDARGPTPAARRLRAIPATVSRADLPCGAWRVWWRDAPGAPSRTRRRVHAPARPGSRCRSARRRW
jgi:hypothetical protein